uniref:G-protein coupled receptors family 3 profile domain-containing protein n=1 Tax=Stomoxys calcitrans TaxID=35570 RepID=A0A1I8NMS5_STOCA
MKYSKRMNMKMFTILLAIIFLRKINGQGQAGEQHPQQQQQQQPYAGNSSSENVSNLDLEVVGDIDDATRTEANKYVDNNFVSPYAKGGGDDITQHNAFEEAKTWDFDVAIVSDDNSHQVLNGEVNDGSEVEARHGHVVEGGVADADMHIDGITPGAQIYHNNKHLQSFVKSHATQHLQQQHNREAQQHYHQHRHRHHRRHHEPNHVNHHQHQRYHQCASHQHQHHENHEHHAPDRLQRTQHHHPPTNSQQQDYNNNYPFEKHKNHFKPLGKNTEGDKGTRKHHTPFKGEQAKRLAFDYDYLNYQNDDSFATTKPDDEIPSPLEFLSPGSLYGLPLTTEYPHLFNTPNDFFFDNGISYPSFMLEPEHQQATHPLPHHHHAQDYVAASPRSGRHRGRVGGNHQHQHHQHHQHHHSSRLQTDEQAAITIKKFRSLPETEQNFQLQPRLLHGLVSQQSHWPIKREAIVEGDVILGGLMMVHSREDNLMCGPIMPQGGIQALEAMLYTIDRINEQGLLPNITLGAHILDDCDKDSYGLEMAVDFIKGSISNIDDAEYHCNKTQVRKVISGVVGAASSVTSIQVANLLRLFRIPQVSFFSTSPELSNKQRFEYFSRTIPSDHYQVKAMVEIVKRLGWSYVSIIYEESNYGIKAFEELEELLARHNICIAVKEKLVKDSGVADETAYNSIVLKLLTKPRARGAIIFGSDQEVREVMRAVRRNNATGAFSWIGSDGWSARNLVSDGNEPEVEGTLSVQPQANPVKGFEEYFLSLTVENNQRNPWFVEFWEDHFQCRYPGSSSTPYNNYNRTCSKTERLSREDTDFEDQLQFVSDAVMAFAYALRDMHRELCDGKPSLCDAMKPTKGADLLRFLRKVEFEGLSGDHFRFDTNGDGPARYNIIHFKQSKEGQYNWVKVGEYYEGELRLNMSEVQFKLMQPKPPESVCSLPCERGQAKKYVEGESCCWHCFNCSTYQIRHPTDETQCLTCQLGTLPDATKQY